MTAAPFLEYNERIGVIIGVKPKSAFQESRKINILCYFLINFINLLEIVQISLTFILYDINILREQKLLRKTLSFP